MAISKYPLSCHPVDGYNTMKQLNLYEAKAHFSSVIQRVGKGERFLIAKAGIPVAELSPISEIKQHAFQFGTMKGKIKLSPDFDAPLVLETQQRKFSYRRQ